MADDTGSAVKTAPAGASVEEIWADVGASLRRFIRRHVSDAHAADDIAAEVLIRIHEHLDDLDHHDRVTAWVFSIARNAVLDHHRRVGRRREVLDVDIDVVDHETADVFLDDQKAVVAELASCIRPLVSALPSDYRRALELTDLEGLTQAEAARREGLSVSGMKSRVQRGRRQFATLLRACCEITTDARGEVVDFEPRLDGDGCGPGCGPA